MEDLLKKQVLALKEKGLSVNKIAKELNTYSSKIYYVLNPEAKKKHLLAKTIWQNNNREKKLIHSKKNRENYLANTLFKEKITNAFGGRKKGRYNSKNIPSVEDFIKKFGRKETYKCYLTGEIIPAKNISLDHIDATKKTTDFTFDNIEITSWKINAMKGTLTVQEFIELCNKVSNYNKK